MHVCTIESKHAHASKHARTHTHTHKHTHYVTLLYHKTATGVGIKTHQKQRQHIPENKRKTDIRDKHEFISWIQVLKNCSTLTINI